MFEAYKVGVTLALQNQVSGVLGLIARDFIKTNREAKALQASLKEIKLLGMTGALIGGAGFLGLGLIKGAVKPASEYVHQLQLAKAAGMSQLEIAKATGAAWEATSQVMTTTAAENIAAIRELRMVFGDTQLAIEHVPTVQKLQSVLQSVRGGGAKDEAYTVAKALEMKGAVKDVHQFDTAADAMTKAIIASGGKVGASDFLSAFKYGRAATIGWDDRFTYSILPTLIQEMKSSGGSGGAGGPGNALMSAYAAVVGGTISQKSLKVWERLGLLDPSKVVWDKVGSAKGVGPGGVRGSSTFQQDPYEWTQKYLIPALLKAGYSTPDQQRQALQYLFSNRTAGFIMSQMALQPWKFARDQTLIQQANGLSAYDQLIKHDPDTAMRALSAQWENFKISVGVAVVPVLIPVLRNLATAFNVLGRFLQDHPTLTSALVLTFTGLSALAAVGGTLMVAGAGIKLIATAFGAMKVVPLATMAISIGSVATALGVLGGAVAALMLITQHKGVANWIDDKTNGKLGDWLNNAANGGYYEEYVMDKRLKAALKSYAPTTSSPKASIDVYVRDPYNLARVVTQAQEKSASGPSTNGALFDGRQSPIWPAYSPGF